MKIQRQKSTLRTYSTSSGAAVPAVTEVLQVAERWDMQRWIAQVGKAEADRIGSEAKVLGTKVHTTAQAEAAAFNKGSTAYHLEEMQPFADAIREFYEKWVSEVVATELALTSDRWGFGGTLDAYVRLTSGEYAVVDFKTSKSLTRIHALQLCAYGMLLREHGYPVNRRLGVRLRKDKPGVWTTREFKNHREDYDGFVGALALWKWQKARAIEKADKAVQSEDSEQLIYSKTAVPDH